MHGQQNIKRYGILLLLALIGLIPCLHYEVFILRPTAVVVPAVSLHSLAR